MNTIDSYILPALALTLGKELGLTVTCSLRSDYTDVITQIDPEKSDVYGFLKIDTIEVNDTGKRARQMARGRLHGVTSVDSVGLPVNGEVVPIIPAIITLEFSFFATDISSFLEISRRWLFAGQNNRVDFNLDYLGAEISIATTLGASLQVPEKLNEYGVGPNGMVFVGEVRTHGYVTASSSENYNAPLIRSVDLDDSQQTQFLSQGFTTTDGHTMNVNLNISEGQT